MSDLSGKANCCTRANTIVESINLRLDNYDLENIKQNILKIDSSISIVEVKKNKEHNYSNDEDEDDYGNSYEKFDGYNEWGDDVIGYAFEGEPEATWNVD